MPIPSGTRIGPYQIVGPLGTGGMGEVYRARDPRLRRDVAIEVIAPRFAADPGRLRRFEHEALAAAALAHPGIIGVYDVGTLAGSPYLADARDLGRELAKLKKQAARGSASVDPLRRANAARRHGSRRRQLVI